MSGQWSFPGFNEEPDEWGRTWNPKGEAPPSSGFADSLFCIEVWKKIEGKNPSQSDSQYTAVYVCYLASKKWKTNREPAKVRAKGHCERCKCKCDALEVHHLTYERFTEELPGDLLALCGSCHALADVERKAAWQKQAAAALYEARFEGFIRRKYGEDYYNYGSASDLESDYEEFEQMMSDRDGRGYE